MPTPKIVRILQVVDTREYQEIGDRYVPIPGSGQPSECARCKREHEVHATVELDDGNIAVVGTGCAQKMDLSVRKAIASAERRAKKLGKLRAELDSVHSLLDAYDEAEAYVNELRTPQIVETTRTLRVGRRQGESYPVLAMGDQWMSLEFAGDLAERRRIERDLALNWKRARIEEHMGVRYANRRGWERRAEQIEDMIQQLESLTC